MIPRLSLIPLRLRSGSLALARVTEARGLVRHEAVVPSRKIAGSAVKSSRLASLFQHALRADLVEGALRGHLVRAPAQELGSVAESALREVIVGNFADQFGSQRLPFSGAFRGPATGAAGSASGKPGRALQSFNLGFKFFSLLSVKALKGPPGFTGRAPGG